MGLLDKLKDIDKTLKEGQTHRKNLREIEKKAYQDQQLKEAKLRGIRKAKQWGHGEKTNWGKKIAGGFAAAGKTYNEIGRHLQNESDAMHGTDKSSKKKRRKKRKSNNKTLTIRY